MGIHHDPAGEAGARWWHAGTNREASRNRRREWWSPRLSGEGTSYLYEIQIPWAALTRDGKVPVSMHFNLAAIDNDNDGLKGWIELATGLGGKKTPYPVADGTLAARALLAAKMSARTRE